MALKDIINSSKYGDDIQLLMPDGTNATLGEIRSMSAEDRQQLTQRQQLVEQAEIAIANKVAEFQKAGLLGPNGQVAPPRTDAEIRTVAASEFGLDPNDPLLGPIVKEFKAEMSKQHKEFQDFQSNIGLQLKQISNVVQTAVGANLEETYNRDFSRATSELPKGVKVDYQQAFEYATKQGLKDKYGRLDMAAAVDRLTWNDVKKAQLAELEAQAAKTGEEKARIATATRPRVSGPEAHRQKTDFDPFQKITTKDGKVREVAKTFDQALAEASNDDSILQSALSTASFGLVN
jgi:hypothetical protein